MNTQAPTTETITLQDIYPRSLLAAATGSCDRADLTLTAAKKAKHSSLFSNATQTAKLQDEIKSLKNKVDALKACIIAKDRSGTDSSGDKVQLSPVEERISKAEAELHAKIAERPEIEKKANARIAKANLTLEQTSEAEKALHSVIKKVDAELAARQASHEHGVGAVMKFKTLQEAVGHFCMVGFSLTQEGAISEVFIEGVLRIPVCGGRAPNMLPHELNWLTAFNTYAILPSYPARTKLLESGPASDDEFSNYFLNTNRPIRCYVDDAGGFLASDAARWVCMPDKKGKDFPALAKLKDYSDLLGSFREALSPHIKEAQSCAPLDMDTEKPLPMLAELIVKAWKKTASTVPAQPAFTPGQARLGQSQIDERIGPYWKAFLKSPWEASIAGSYALLKHRCTRGETPNVFACGTHGHFGFRVRTPDHDWITGEIYCPPEHFAPAKDPGQMEVINHLQGPDWLAELGPVKFLIRGKTSHS